MHNITIICLIISFVTLITPVSNSDSDSSFTNKNKQIVGIISLLIAYYYFNNEKLF